MRIVVYCNLAAALLAGCASTPGERLKTNVKEFQEEQSPDKLFERGKGFAAVGDTTRAEEYLTAALAAGADDKKVVPVLVRVCIRDQRFRSGIEHAENYLNKHPGDTGTRFILGTMYVAVGDMGKAKTELSRVVAEKPDLAGAQYALGVVYKEMNDPVAADHNFRAYLRLEPHGEYAPEAQSSLLKSMKPEESAQ
jgi:Tfp pilus assembly protein PilF